jgi:hypothetical protein
MPRCWTVGHRFGVGFELRRQIEQLLRQIAAWEQLKNSSAALRQWLAVVIGPWQNHRS